MADEVITMTIDSPVEYGLYALAFDRPELFREAEEFKGVMLAERTSLAERVKAIVGDMVPRSQLKAAQEQAEDEFEIRCAEERTTAALTARIAELEEACAEWCLKWNALERVAKRRREALERIAEGDLLVDYGDYVRMASPSEIASEALTPSADSERREG